MQTYGEQLVERLLRGLPPRKYFYRAEPTIVSSGSARKNPDFIIVGGMLGVIVLEVKDWTRIVKITQKIVEVVRPDGSVEEEENPVLTARQYALNLAERFNKREELRRMHLGKKKLKFPWMSAVALPNIDSAIIKRAEEQGIWDASAVFGKSELTSEKFELALRSMQWPWRLEYPLSSDVLDVIRGVIDPSLVIEDSLGNDIGTITLKQESLIREPIKQPEPARRQAILSPEFMTDEALALSENTSVRLVRGVAGSGKTLVLARRAQYLAEQFPDYRLLVLAFNVDLVADLKRRINGAPQLEVINFHKMCARILGKFWQSPNDIESWLNEHVSTLMSENQLDAAFVADEIEWRKELDLYDGEAYLAAPRNGRGRSLSREKRAIINQIFDEYLSYQRTQQITDWSDVPSRVLGHLTPSHPLYQSYDVILIDEAQDFAPSWISIVKRLLKPGGSLFMCDDPRQSLFRAFSWKQKGVEVTGRTRILRVPFRCTRQITELAYSLINADAPSGLTEDLPTPDLKTYELALGELPKLFACWHLDHEIRFVEKQALSLQAAGIPSDRIAILCHSKRLVRHWAHLRNQGYYVESFFKMKGLEFQAVLIPHLQTSFDQAGSEEIDISAIRRQLFTAMTRAREHLILSYHGRLPRPLDPITPYVEQLTVV